MGAGRFWPRQVSPKGRRHHHIRDSDSRFVCRTDIKGYYAHIDKKHLLDAAARYVACPRLMSLLRQFVHYSVEWGGNFHTPHRGIARASSLSPLPSAYYLYELDVSFSERRDIHYIRYMDDFVIMTRTRWQLHRLHQWFQSVGMAQHPGKTFIGRIDKGFDWMGFQLSHCGLTGIGLRAQQNHLRKRRRLYEQLRNRPARERDGRMAIYEDAWLQWALTPFTVTPPEGYTRVTTRGAPTQTGRYLYVRNAYVHGHRPGDRRLDRLIEIQLHRPGPDESRMILQVRPIRQHRLITRPAARP